MGLSGVRKAEQGAMVRGRNEGDRQESRALTWKRWISSASSACSSPSSSMLLDFFSRDSNTEGFQDRFGELKSTKVKALI